MSASLNSLSMSSVNRIQIGKEYMKIAVFVALIALVGLSACDPSEMNFPVIGLDKDGKLAQVMVPESQYSERLRLGV